MTGNPIPEISWNVRGHLIRGGGDKYKVTPEGLIISNVTKGDQGNYKCKATQLEDGVSDFKDLVIQLKVQRKTKNFYLKLKYYPPASEASRGVY